MDAPGLVPNESGVNVLQRLFSQMLHDFIFVYGIEAAILQCSMTAQPLNANSCCDESAKQEMGIILGETGCNAAWNVSLQPYT